MSVLAMVVFVVILLVADQTIAYLGRRVGRDIDAEHDRWRS